MATSRMTYIQRERAVLNDLEASFPDFTGRAVSWTELHAGQDPPDFISRGTSGTVGLELVEWVDGGQMTPAKSRESQREHVQRLLGDGWEKEYQPKNSRGAYPSPLDGMKIARTDELPLRREFYAYAAAIDHDWLADPIAGGRRITEEIFRAIRCSRNTSIQSISSVANRTANAGFIRTGMAERLIPICRSKH
jgi:hypothetical protein